ncbi:MAG TPA: hypothetical protein VFJ58_11720 [Armatimonadota bacterium]|nr:hypothetical protein [Armatimonadota bacterium]
MTEFGKGPHPDPEQDNPDDRGRDGIPPIHASGEYTAATGKSYTYEMDACDWDFDHPEACLFRFIVRGPARSFEKIIPVNRQDLGSPPAGMAMQAARQAAEAKLFMKLDDENEADEPTPLR